MCISAAALQSKKRGSWQRESCRDDTGNIVAGSAQDPFHRQAGDIKISSFVADEGALFRGKCEMIDETEPETNHTKRKRNYRKSTVLEDIYESGGSGSDS